MNPKNLKKDQLVYVPAKSVKIDPLEYPSAMVSCKVSEVKRNNVVLYDIPTKKHDLETVKSGILRRKLGILILRVGDYNSEDSLLDPLFNAVCSISSLLLTSDSIFALKIRTFKELQYYWIKYNASISHIVIIGHGYKDQGLVFGNKPDSQCLIDYNKNSRNPKNESDFLEIVSADQVINTLQLNNGSNQGVDIISLSCFTGMRSFGKKIGGAPFCSFFAGARKAVNPMDAIYFYNEFVTEYFLNGAKVKDAFEKANVKSEFAMWSKQNQSE
jgi:hypothetical protein